MRVTRNNIANAIFDKTGHKIELVKGNGYNYFVSAEDDHRTAPITYAYDASVMVNSIGLFSVDRWVSDYEYLIRDVDVAERRANAARFEGRFVKLS